MPGSKKKTMDDVSDDDEDWYDTQADIDREANDDEDDASKLPNFESYDEFWAFTQEKNAQAVRDAGGDPAKTPGADNLPKGTARRDAQEGRAAVRQGSVLGLRRGDHDAAGVRSVPRDHEGKGRQGGVRQLGTRVLLLAPVLQRALPEHKARHGPSKSVPTKTDGTIHRFPCAEGCGALWDAKTLKRYNFEECEPYD